MSTESADAYDPVFPETPRGEGDEEGFAALRSFERASRAYLASPVPWIGWALILPAAALLTVPAGRALGAGGVVGLWSAAILLGGGVEAVALVRARRRRSPGVLGGWAMAVQGNLSLVALALSLALWAAGAVHLLPALWLLVLGHSFFALGGLSLRELRRAGVLYQLGGLAALFPRVPALEVLAVVTLLGNLWVAVGIWRRELRS